jgi:hypothetical protein
MYVAINYVMLEIEVQTMILAPEIGCLHCVATARTRHDGGFRYSKFSNIGAEI